MVLSESSFKGSRSGLGINQEMAQERYAMADAIDREIRRLQELKYQLLDEAILIEQEREGGRVDEGSIALGAFSEQEVPIDLSFEGSRSIDIFTGAEATGRSIQWDLSMPGDQFAEQMIVLSDDELDSDVEEPLRLEDVMRDL